MSRATLIPPFLTAVALAALLGGLVACGGSSPGSNSAYEPCATLGSAEYATAVNRYLDDISPKPLRFLMIAVGDSALPGPAGDALQMKGPTFLFPGTPEQQKQVLDRLEQEGSYPTLLVVYLGSMPPAKGSATVRLAGRFVDKDDTASRAPVKSLHFSCKDGKWSFDKADVEQGA